MDSVCTNPGVFFKIENGCSTAAKGFAVGDKLYLLAIGSATFMRPVFQGDLKPGETRLVMTGAGEDGKGVVLFVPSARSGAKAVLKTVSPGETIKVPESYCGSEGSVDRDQFKIG